MKEQKPEKENDSSNRVVVVPYARREELKRQREKKSSFRQGPWSSEERLLFLKGLRLYGEGRWKEIGSVVTTRSNVQIKTHAQKILEKMKAGENVFWELDKAEAEGRLPASTLVEEQAALADDYSQSLGFSLANGYRNDHMFRHSIESSDEVVVAAFILCEMASITGAEHGAKH